MRLTFGFWGGMKKSGLWVLAICLSLCVSIVAQDSGKRTASGASQVRHAKTIRLSGKVSDDGTRFIDEVNRRVWIIKNIAALKGFESQMAFLRGRIEGDTNLIEVLSIIGRETNTAHLSDSAFRR